MATTYHLSGRQEKEVAERGRLLRIALPLPDDFGDDGDPRQFARDVLDVPARWVRSAEIVELPVIAPLQAGGDGLAGRLGSIAHDDCDRGRLLIYRVICCLVEIAAGRTRHTARTQWPGSVTIEGVEYPH